jgi:hypothetical protein
MRIHGQRAKTLRFVDGALLVVPGSNIADVCRELVMAASERGAIATVEFNGAAITATGTENPEALESKWHADREDRLRALKTPKTEPKIQAVSMPEPKIRAYHVKQAGGRDLGVLRGYMDTHGLFRTEGGGVYGCLYSVEPVKPSKPKSTELPKMEAGACVARRLRVELVKDGFALFDDGSWEQASAWNLNNFLPDVGHDDIPF